MVINTWSKKRHSHASPTRSAREEEKREKGEKEEENGSNGSQPGRDGRFSRCLLTLRGPFLTSSCCACVFARVPNGEEEGDALEESISKAEPSRVSHFCLPPRDFPDKEAAAEQGITDSTVPCPR